MKGGLVVGDENGKSGARSYYAPGKFDQCYTYVEDDLGVVSQFISRYTNVRLYQAMLYGHLSKPGWRLKD